MKEIIKGYGYAMQIFLNCLNVNSIVSLYDRNHDIFV